MGLARFCSHWWHRHLRQPRQRRGRLGSWRQRERRMGNLVAEGTKGVRRYVLVFARSSREVPTRNRLWGIATGFARRSDYLLGSAWHAQLCLPRSRAVRPGLPPLPTHLVRAPRLLQRPVAARKPDPRPGVSQIIRLTVSVHSRAMTA